MAETKSSDGGLEYLEKVNPPEAGALSEALRRARNAGEAALRAGPVSVGPKPISPGAANYDPGNKWAAGEGWPGGLQLREAGHPAEAPLLGLVPAATRHTL